ncbi:MAG: IPT/TIG domain-containing protein [Myxococcales bacterium]|nr:IPT/TIG domain-containing protein [Myxococcales bacterium]
MILRRTFSVDLGSVVMISLMLFGAVACSDDTSNTGTNDSGTDIVSEKDSGLGEDSQTIDVPTDDVFGDKDTGGAGDISTADVGTDSGTPGETDTGGAEPPSLEIYSVSPGSGSSAGGDSVVIEGVGFVEGATVYFAESLAENTFYIDTNTVLCDSPPRPPGLVNVRVQNPAPGPDLPAPEAVLENAYLYVNPVSVTSVEPAVGHVDGGMRVTVFGSGFVSGSKVLFGSKSAINVTVLSDSEILAVTPTGTVGFAGVHVSNNKGVGSKKNAFYYYDEPAIHLVDPPNGPTAGGNEVVIHGSAFLGDVVVRLGGAIVEGVQVPSFDRIVFVAPKGVAGAVDVEVETTYGIALMPGGYTYYDPNNPNVETMLLGVSPSHGPVSGGETATITAYGLTDVADTVVLFDGVLQAEVLTVDLATFSAIVKTPAGAAPGLVSVTLSNSNGVSTLEAGYLYESVVTVDSVSPNLGPVSGGTTITISGSGFAPGAEVRVGALPVLSSTIVDAQTIEAVTPPGSAGFVPVSVKVGDAKGKKPDAFFYQSDAMELFLVDPNLGSIAGGTQIRLIGQGFPGDAKVWVDGNPASHITVQDSTLIIAKTPPGQIGTVDVEVTSPQGNLYLPESFTYFNPESSLGGTWGGKVEGTLNVTVKDIDSGLPIPDAFVILATDAKTPYQGFTNLFGQITFSGPDVLGSQMVSASKIEYESASVVDFDATNITIFLTPIPPPTPGDPPPGIEVPLVSGKLVGLDKYTIIPVGSCLKKPGAPAPLCQACTDNTQCGEGNQCSVIGATTTQKFCTTPCTSAAECPDGFVCGSTGGSAQCLPSPGKKVAQCYTTKPTIFADDIEAAVGAWGPDDQWQVTSEGGNYTVFAYPGEVAVVCMGGYLDYDDGQFVPLTLGVARHVFTAPGQTTADQDVKLEFQMDRNITVLLANTPQPTPLGPNFAGLFSYMDFGSEGVLEMKHTLPVQNFGIPLVIERQVRQFTGAIFDVSFTFLGGAFSATANNLPMSLVLARNVTKIEDDTIFSLAPEGWKANATGITKNIHGLWGTAADNVYGVGADGSIIYYNGGVWTPQQSPIKAALNDLWGSGPMDIWAVGDGGAIVHFDGASWSSAAQSPTTAKLNGIWGSGADNMYAVGQFAVVRYDGTNWLPYNVGLAAKDYQDVYGVDGENFWIVAKDGWIYSFDSTKGKWKPKQLPSKNDLYGTWATTANDIWVVGEAGTIAHFDGAEWTELETGVSETLRDIWGTGPDNIYVVGDGGTLLHYDGFEWNNQSFSDYTNGLLAVWGVDEQNVFSVGTHEFVLGPLLEVPEPISPTNGATLSKYEIKFKVADGFPASFHYINMTIPGLMGDTPMWFMITDGDVTDIELPEFPAIEGTPGIVSGPVNLLLLRAYKPGFDINNYDYTDLYQLDWRAWSIDAISFIKD